MGYLLGIVWCAVFGGFGLFLIHQRKKYSTYSTFIAKVESVETINGRHTAILHSGIQKIGNFNIEFQDLGDFYKGQSVECMWDGKNQDTAQEDLRKNQKLGIIFSFFAVAVMVVIFVITLIY
jgi:hypothetical protein